MYESTSCGILFIYTHLCRIHQSKRSRTCGSEAGCRLLVSPTVARGRRAHKSGLQSDRAPGSTAHLPYSKQRVKFMKLSLSHTAVGGHQTVLQTVLNTTGTPGRVLQDRRARSPGVHQAHERRGALGAYHHATEVLDVEIRQLRE